MSGKQTLSTKIVILGEPAVGKTTLRVNLIGKPATQGDYMMTLGAEIGETKIEVGNVVFEAQVWDIAGQENFLPITKPMMKGVQGAVIVFDLTRDYTFKEVNKWIDRMHEVNRDLDNNIPMIIVGNKADLGDAFIKFNDEEASTFVEYVNRHDVYSKTNTEYIKTSAKTGYQVKEAFERLARVMVENFRLSGMDIDIGEEPKTEHKEIVAPVIEEEPEKSGNGEEFLSVSEILRRKREGISDSDESTSEKLASQGIQETSIIDSQEVYIPHSIEEEKTIEKSSESNEDEVNVSSPRVHGTSSTPGIRRRDPKPSYNPFISKRTEPSASSKREEPSIPPQREPKAEASYPSYEEVEDEYPSYEDYEEKEEDPKPVEPEKESSMPEVVEKLPPFQPESSLSKENEDRFVKPEPIPISEKEFIPKSSPLPPSRSFDNKKTEEEKKKKERESEIEKQTEN